MLASEFIKSLQAFVDEKGDLPFAVDAHFGYYSDLWFAIEELTDTGQEEYELPESEDAPITRVLALQLGTK